MPQLISNYSNEQGAWQYGAFQRFAYSFTPFFAMKWNLKRIILANQQKAIDSYLAIIRRWQPQLKLAPFDSRDIFTRAMPNVNGRHLCILIEQHGEPRDNFRNRYTDITIAIVPEWAENESVGGDLVEHYLNVFEGLLDTMAPKELVWGPRDETQTNGVDNESESAWKDWEKRQAAPAKQVLSQLTGGLFPGYQENRVENALHVYLTAVSGPGR